MALVRLRSRSEVVSPVTLPEVVAVKPVVPTAPVAPLATSFTPGRFISQDSWAKRFGAWGSLFVTAIIFVLLTIGLIFSARLQDPPTAFSNLMETVKNLAMIAAGFWLGSSNSSQKKDDTIADGTAALAVSAPVEGVVVSKPNG